MVQVDEMVVDVVPQDGVEDFNSAIAYAADFHARNIISGDLEMVSKPLRNLLGTAPIKVDIFTRFDVRVFGDIGERSKRFESGIASWSSTR